MRSLAHMNNSIEEFRGLFLITLHLISEIEADYL